MTALAQSDTAVENFTFILFYFLICCMGYDARTAAFCILFIQPVLWCKFSSKSRLAAQEKCAPHKASPFLKNS